MSIADEDNSQFLLKEMTKKKINYLLSKHSIKDTDVYSVIKEFFKEFLGAKYEFTFEELHEELKKIYLEKHVRDALIALIDKFRTIEYKDDEIPQDVLKHILSEFNKLVDHLIQEQVKKGFLTKLFGKSPSAQTKQPFPVLEPKELKDLISNAPVKTQKITAVPKDSFPAITPLAALEPLDVALSKESEVVYAAPTSENKSTAQASPVKSWSESLHQSEDLQPQSTDWTESESQAPLNKKSRFVQDVSIEKKATGNFIFGVDNHIPLSEQQPTSVSSTPTPVQEKKPAPVKKSPIPVKTSPPPSAAPSVKPVVKTTPMVNPIPVTTKKVIESVKIKTPVAQQQPKQSPPKQQVQTPSTTVPVEEKKALITPTTTTPVQTLPANPPLVQTPQNKLTPMQKMVNSVKKMTPSLKPAEKKGDTQITSTPLAQVKKEIPPQTISKSTAVPATEKKVLSNPRVSQQKKPDSELILDLKTLAKELDDALEKSQSPTLDQMISSVKNHLSNSDLSKAKMTYKELLGKYDELSEEDKHPYFERIQQLYESLTQQK